MKKIKYNYLLLVILTFSLGSCKKFLDQDPISAVTDATSWKTENDVNSQVAGCYSLIRAAFNASCSYYAYGDLPTDYWIEVQDADFKNIYLTNWAISVPALNTYDPKLKLRNWTPFYSAIQQANRCIHFINQMPNSAFSGDDESGQIASKNKYLAEAKYCRAFNYFYMSRVWGDVPLDTTYQEEISNITSDPRVAQSEVLKSALSDLAYAKQWLNYKDASSSDRTVRADKGAVFALLANLYAWQSDYDNCKSACDSVISQGGYSLVPGQNIATIFNGQSSEGIFEISQNNASEGQNAIQYAGSIANYTLATPYLTNSTPNWQIGTNYLLDLYKDTSDYRFQQEFTFANSGSVRYYFSKKYSNISTITANDVIYYLLRNNFIVFRLGGIYLLRAEANAAKSSPDFGSAIADVNTVRNRAGIAPLTSFNGLSKTALLDSVLQEQSRELFLEGSHFYDLVRNARLTGTSKFPNINQSDFTQGKYYWPIDPSLMVLNSGLVQTPFWQQLLTY